VKLLQHPAVAYLILVRSMRSLLVIVAAVVISRSVVAADVGLEVLAPISREDERQITQIVKHFTASEITLIRAVQSPNPPFETYVDKVLVFVGPDQKGGPYRLEKANGAWHITQLPKT
jgi:hypothetical protein